MKQKIKCILGLIFIRCDGYGNYDDNLWKEILKDERRCLILAV